MRNKLMKLKLKIKYKLKVIAIKKLLEINYLYGESKKD